MIASNRIFQCYYSTSRLEFNSIYLMAGIHDVITEIRKIQSGLPQGVLSPLLYLLYTAGLSADANVSIATFADDMAVLAIDEDPSIAFKYLQDNLNLIQN